MKHKEQSSSVPDPSTLDSQEKGTKNQSLIKRLRQLLFPQRSESNPDTNSSQFGWETRELALNHLFIIVKSLADQLGSPLRLVVDQRVYWFDANGDAITHPVNISRFESQLNSDKLTSFVTSMSIDGHTPDLELIRAQLEDILKRLDTPIKLNKTWINQQATVIDDSQSERFERLFGEQASSEIM